MAYWQLKSIADAQRAWERDYYALPPDACPRCGTPLEVAQVTQSGGGREMRRNCPMGHYTYTGGRRET